MKIKGVEFGNIFMGAGTQNFFGEGWRPIDSVYELIPGYSFQDVTFVSKTTTMYERAGNMKLKKNLQPAKLFPDCIKMYFLEGVMLNSVGLSGPGAEALLKKGEWQKRTKPFLISFMAVGEAEHRRLAEAREFAHLINRYRQEFQTEFGIEVNFSCPNTNHATEKLIKEARIILQQIRKTNLPIFIKVNVLIDPLLVKEIVTADLCDAITVSNTIPYGQLPELIDWEGLFGSESPILKTNPKYGGGGLSGWRLLPIVADWVGRARDADIQLPIVAGGGIQKPEDVDVLMYGGATAISLCSVYKLRPWRPAKIIQHTNTKFFRRK